MIENSYIIYIQQKIFSWRLYNQIWQERRCFRPTNEQFKVETVSSLRMRTVWLDRSQGKDFYHQFTINTLTLKSYVLSILCK